MARMYPISIDQETRSSAERRFFEALQRELPEDEWVVIHQVRWVGHDHRRQPCDGEADFVIAHRDHGVLIVEIKGGRIRFDPNLAHFISTDRHGIDYDIGDPFQQATQSKHNLIVKLRSARGWPRQNVVFGHAVGFIDQMISDQPLRPNAPRELIIDARDLVSLKQRIIAALNASRRDFDTAPGATAVEVLVQTLAHAHTIRNPLLSEEVRATDQALVRLTDGQLRYLRFLAGRRRAAIAGCAGSGKTFLAIEKARHLAAETQGRLLFTCYNRDLADYIGDTLGYRKIFDVYDFHQLCTHWARTAGATLPRQAHNSEAYFRTELPQALLEAVEKLGSQYDGIVVDEGQDFMAEWWDALPWLLHDPAQGYLYVFFDDNQQVYRNRSPLPIQAEPFVLNENCRNTRQIFQVVERFYQGEALPTCLGPNGVQVVVQTYTTAQAGLDCLRRQLHRLINEEGFKPEEIAVLSARGSETSAIFGERLGNFTLVNHTPNGTNQIFATTVRRFKGLERSAIVLCEIDNRLAPEDAETLLYVGTSRPRSYLVVLHSEEAPETVRSAFQGIRQGVDRSV